MKIGKEEFSHYWKFIKFPVIILVVWNILSYIASESFQSWYISIFSGTPNFIFQIAVFAFLGYLALRYKATANSATWGGAIAGIIVGIFASLITLFSVYSNPEIITIAVQAIMKEAEVTEEIARLSIKIALYIGAFLEPLIAGFLGAVSSRLSYMVFKKYQSK